jgi:hypothetical protein
MPGAAVGGAAASIERGMSMSLDVVERRAAILALAREKGVIRHSDVTEICPYWCGETIRLDLVYLCWTGALRPIGKRRHRRYIPAERNAA